MNTEEQKCVANLEALCNEDYYLHVRRIHPRRLAEIREADKALDLENGDMKPWRLFSEEECHRNELLVELDATTRELAFVRQQLEEAKGNLLNAMSQYT